MLLTYILCNPFEERVLKTTTFACKIDNAAREWGGGETETESEGERD